MRSFAFSLAVDESSVSLWLRNVTQIVLPPLVFLAVLLGQGQAHADEVPSSDVDHPFPLQVGEVVKGRLGNSDEGGKSHYWLVNLPPGTYKAVIDVKRADDRDSNVGGHLEWLNLDGKKLESLGHLNAIDARLRAVFRFSLKTNLKAILRYSNSFTVSDYWLGVFKADANIPVPFFVATPKVQLLSLGQPATATLRGETTNARDSYYSMRLPAGDYKISTEYRRSDGKKSNVGGELSILDSDGQRRDRLHFANQLDAFTREVNKLSLAEEVIVIFRVSARFASQSVTLAVERFVE